MTVEFEDGWSQEDKPVEDDEEDLAVAAEWAVVRGGAEWKWAG